LDDKPEVVENIAQTCRSRASKGSALKAIYIAGLCNESASSLLLASTVSTIDVSETWVEEVLFDSYHSNVGM